LPGIGQFQDGRKGGCNNHCQTRGCDEKNTPQDLAISLLWIAFVHTRDTSSVVKEGSVTVDNPIHVPRELSNEEFEAVRSRVENLLRNEAD
jgi:hypothetical protein